MSELPFGDKNPNARPVSPKPQDNDVARALLSNYWHGVRSSYSLVSANQRNSVY